jgi:hypothetical protein
MSSAAQTTQKNDLPSTISVKLDRENFPLWKSLVLPLIKGSKLDGYLLGTKQRPEQYITSTSTDPNSKKINPEFEDWLAHDQQVLGWLRNSMTAGIAT